MRLLHSVLRRSAPILILLGLCGAASLHAQSKDEVIKRLAPHEKGADNSARAIETEEKERRVLDIPIPEGHEVKGIKVPYFSLEGVKQMEFFAAVANRVDADHIELEDVRMELFTDEGESDMVIILPKSVFNVKAENIVSDSDVVIRRNDFRIKGEKMIFDTRTRKGKLIGKVNMRIYNKEGMLAPKKAKD